MTRALSPQDIYLLQCVTDVQLSPNGLQVAYVVKTADRERDWYRSRIAVVDVDSGRSEQRTTGEQVARFIRYPRGGHDLTRTGPPSIRAHHMQNQIEWFDEYLSTTSRQSPRHP